MDDPLILVCSTEWDSKWSRLVEEHLSALGLATKQRLAHLVPGADGLISARAARAIDTARLSVLVLTPDFLASRHLMRDALPKLVLRASLVLKHGQTGDTEFLPIVAKECQWGLLPETVGMNVTPALQVPLEKREPRDAHKALFQATRKAYEYLARIKALPDDLRWTAPPASAVQLGPLEGAALTREFQDREQAQHELNVAWMNPETRVVNLVGPAGSGKSTLLAHWLQVLARDKYRGAERVFVWSFDQQRGAGQATTADEFLHGLREFLILVDDSEKPYWEQGALAAAHLQDRRTLLVLDGLDPLLASDGLDDAVLRDEATLFLLRKFLGGEQGLCVVASRRPLADLASWTGRGLATVQLEPLSPAEGAELWQKMKVPGGGDSHREAARCAQGQPIPLRLLGSWLAANFLPHAGRSADHERFLLPGDEVPLTPLLEAWAAQIGEGPAVRLVRLLAVSDRPLDRDALRNLAAREPVPGLTDGLRELDLDALDSLLDRLRWAGLVTENAAQLVDLPEAIREHFRNQIVAAAPGVWRGAHALFADQLLPPGSAPPAALRQRIAALRAFRHSCQAGIARLALGNLFLQRIWGSGDDAGWSPSRQMCARLEALSPLLDPKTQLPLADLEPGDWQTVARLWRKGLRATGRLADAAAAAEREKVWARNHARLDQMAECLLEQSELWLLLGKLKEASRTINELFSLPDLQSQPQRFRDAITLSARVMQLKGQFKPALERYRLAAASPAPATLLSGAECWHCDAILDSGDFPTAERTAWREFERYADHDDRAAGGFALVLVRLYFALRSHSGDWRYREESAKHLAAARRASIHAGLVEMQVPVQLAVAMLQRHEEQFSEATQHLIDATVLATRAGLRFLELDCQLEAIRLKLDQGLARDIPRRVEQLRQKVVEAQYGRAGRDFKLIEQRFTVVSKV